MKWVLLPPLYRDEDMEYLDYPPKGVKKFAVGKGSAAKTLDVIGGRPTQDADVDMGWAQIHISSKTGKMEISFGGGQEAANDRWDMEREAMDEWEREAYAELPTTPMVSRIPRARPIRPRVEAETYLSETNGDADLALSEVERYQAGREELRNGNRRSVINDEEMVYIPPYYRRRRNNGTRLVEGESDARLQTKTYLGNRLRQSSIGTGV